MTVAVEQRRRGLLALIALALVLGMAVLGAAETLGYAAPTLGLLALLVLGCYPGAETLERLSSRTRRQPRRQPASSARPSCPIRAVPRLHIPSVGRRGPPAACRT